MEERVGQSTAEAPYRTETREANGEDESDDEGIRDTFAAFSASSVCSWIDLDKGMVTDMDTDLDLDMDMDMDLDMDLDLDMLMQNDADGGPGNRRLETREAGS